VEKLHTLETRREVEIHRTVETRRIYTTRTEHIAPRNIQSFGPIFITFEKAPREGLDLDRWMRELGPRLVAESRRG